MEDMISGSIPQSMRLNDEYPKLGMNYSTLLENDQNLLQGIVSGNNNMNNDGGVLNNNSNSKRPSSLFWPEEEDHSGISSNKRLHFENSPNAPSPSITTRTHSNDNNNPQNSTSSLATLLTNLPQTPPPLHPHAHTVLGSIGDTLFRPAYQIPGANWYS